MIGEAGSRTDARKDKLIGGFSTLNIESDSTEPFDLELTAERLIAG